MTSQDGPRDDSEGKEPQPAYVAPRIRSYSPAEFLDLIGPAQGYGGGGGSTEHGSKSNKGIGGSNHLFPGLR